MLHSPFCSQVIRLRKSKYVAGMMKKHDPWGSFILARKLRWFQMGSQRIPFHDYIMHWQRPLQEKNSLSLSVNEP